MSLNNLPTGHRVTQDEHGETCETHDTDSYTSHRRGTQRCVQGAKLIRGRGEKEGQRGIGVGVKKRGKVE